MSERAAPLRGSGPAGFAWGGRGKAVPSGPRVSVMESGTLSKEGFPHPRAYHTPVWQSLQACVSAESDESCAGPVSRVRGTESSPGIQWRSHDS